MPVTTTDKFFVRIVKAASVFNIDFAVSILV